MRFKIKGNAVKGWLTSILGVLFIGATLFLWFLGFISLVWEGAVAIVLGVILLYAPRTIEKKLSEAIKAWGGRGGGGNWGGGGNIDIEIGNKGGRGQVPPTPDTDGPSIKDEPR